MAEQSLDPKNEIDRELIKGSTITLILTVLSRREMYGYEIIKEIARGSKGALDPKEGTIYPVLHQLEKDGSVTARWDESEGARKRKFYRITAAGRKKLQQKKKEWATFRSLMDRLIAAGSASQALDPIG